MGVTDAMRIKTLPRIIALFLLVIIALSSGGCRLDTIQHNNDYVASVKRLVDDVVKDTREIKTFRETFNCRETEPSKQYISVMDSLCDSFQQILKLQATNEFDDYDNQLKESAKQALQEISQLKSLTSYSVETGDDTFYQNDVKELYQAYEFSYENLKDLSAQIQTYWRNA